MSTVKEKYKNATEAAGIHCMTCNIFQLKCDGRKRWIQNYDCLDRKTKGCGNRVFTPDNTNSPLQVRAFYSLYAAKKRMGFSNEMAFAGAIVDTSDEQFTKAKQLRPELVAEGEVQIKRTKRLVGRNCVNHKWEILNKQH